MPRHSRLESERLTTGVQEAAERALMHGCRGQGRRDTQDRGTGETPRTGAQGRGDTQDQGPGQGRRSGPGPGGDTQDRGPGETLRAGPRAMITEGRLVVLEGEVPRGSVLLTAIRSP